MSNRVDDDEILFVALILMFGEPPTGPKTYTGGHFGEQIKFFHDQKHYGLRVKDMMAELGHDPHQGLYTSYMHWAKEQWDAKQNEPKSTQAQARKEGANLHNMLVSSRPTTVKF